MPTQEQNPQQKVTVVYSPLRISWRNVLLGSIIGLLIVAIGVFAFSYYSPTATPVPSIEIKKGTPSAKVATKSATPSTKKDETADWKTYKNTDLKIQVKYPVGWYVYDNATSPCTDRIPTYVFVNKEPLTECLFADVLPADFYISVGSPWNPESDEFDTYNSYNINGEKGFINITTEKSQGPRRKETRVIVTYKEKGYTISLPNTDYKGTHEKIYDTILSTFKFLD